MFDNIGGKIKALASASAVLGIIVSIFAGLLVLLGSSFLTGILIIVIGSLASWIASFTLYGFGELVDCAQIIAHNMPEKSASPKKVTLPMDPEHTWTCSYCGTENSILTYQCSKCGKYGKS